ncbi:MAG: hypothetical protein ACSLFP_03910 [Acidimicrobiales bacterium]
MSRWRERLDDALWGPDTGARLLVVHIGLSALIGLRVVLGSYRQLADTPAPLFDPVPILAFLPGMPEAWVFVALQAVGGLAALAAVLRRRPRLAFAVAWGCYLVLAGLRGSRGKVLHNDLLLLWASAPFLLAPVSVSWNDRTARRDHGWPLRSAMVIAALIYFFAGYHKVRRSGLDWAIGDNVRYVMLWGPSVGAAKWDALATWVGERLWAAKATGAFILTFELTFPLVLLWRRLQPWYALVAVALHVTTYLLLGLDYWAWACTVTLLFFDWPTVVDRARGRWGARAVRGATPQPG